MKNAPPKTVLPGEVVEDGGSATLDGVRLHRGGQILRRWEKRGKLGNELSRGGKEPAGRVVRKKTRGQVAGPERTRVRVVRDAVAGRAPAEPLSPR